MTSHTATAHQTSPRPADSGRWLIWTAGLIVATGAAIATAHGLYRVALAATVPPPIAWLYPLITDGLALVAYAATTRLAAGGRAYAWAVVVLAAGLSGLAQASYLAIGVNTAPVQLRFGVGAWPAVAAAITAHLLYLLAAHPGSVQPQGAGRGEVGRLDTPRPPAVGQPTVGRSTVGRLDGAVQPAPVGHRRPAVVVAPVGHADAAVGRLDHGRPTNPQTPAGAGVPDGTCRAVGDPLSRPDGTGSPALPPAATVTDPHRDPDDHRDGVQPVAVQLVQPVVGHQPVGQPSTVRPVEPSNVGQARIAEAGLGDLAPPTRDHPVGQAAVRPAGTVGHQPASDRRDVTADAPVDRALAAALAHQAEAGGLPSVRALADAAGVSRGTAATALQQLRDLAATPRLGLRVVPDQADIESTR